MAQEAAVFQPEIALGSRKGALSVVAFATFVQELDCSRIRWQTGRFPPQFWTFAV
ncbi:hypothetical protein [Qipengyuania sp. SM2507]